METEKEKNMFPYVMMRLPVIPELSIVQSSKKSKNDFSYIASRMMKAAMELSMPQLVEITDDGGISEGISKIKSHPPSESAMLFSDNLSNSMFQNEVGIEDWIVDHARKMSNKGMGTHQNDSSKKRKKKKKKKKAKEKLEIKAEPDPEHTHVHCTSTVTRLENRVQKLDKGEIKDNRISSATYKKDTQKMAENERLLRDFYLNCMTEAEKLSLCDIDSSDVFYDILAKHEFFEPECSCLECTMDQGTLKMVFDNMFVYNRVAVNIFLDDTIVDKFVLVDDEGQQVAQSDLVFFESIDMETLEAKYNLRDLQLFMDIKKRFLVLLGEKDDSEKSRGFGIELDSDEEVMDNAMTIPKIKEAFDESLALTLSLAVAYTAERILQLYREHVAMKTRQELLKEEEDKETRLLKRREKKKKRRRVKKARKKNVKDSDETDDVGESPTSEKSRLEGEDTAGSVEKDESIMESESVEGQDEYEAALEEDEKLGGDARIEFASEQANMYAWESINSPKAMARPKTDKTSSFDEKREHHEVLEIDANENESNSDISSVEVDMNIDPFFESLLSIRKEYSASKENSHMSYLF